MTHECSGTGPHGFAVFVDDGRSSTLIWRGTLDTAAAAEQQIETYRANWGPTYAAREMIVVRVCEGEGGGTVICGGRDAAIPARLRGHIADATKKGHIGQPPVGGEG